jgi:NRAMP (natural resistance-associated macrophage protein)-like metal ion transporter
MEDVARKIADTPSNLLSGSITVSKGVMKRVRNQRHLKRAEEYWHTLGPGLTTGAADDDPSGIATYSQAGAGYGFQLLWLAAFTFPLMAIVQEMCARIGLVTGRGLAGNIRIHFSRKVLYMCTILLFIANTLNIGADLGAMAKGVQLIFPHLDFTWIVIGFTVLTLALQIFTSYEKYAKYLKWLALLLLSYIFSALSVHLDPKALLQSVVFPVITFSKEQIILICAILGTTISPYLFFWQSDEEVEEEIATGKLKMMGKGIPKISGMDIRNMRADTVIGMFFSNLVSFFIIATCAATLHAEGITNIETADQAAAALLPLAGPFAFALFALGIISTGLLAVPILAGGASYAVSESMGWAEGLGKRFSQAKAFYLTIAVATGLGLFINFLGIPPFQMLYYAAVVNGVCAPPLIFAIVALSRDKKTMGKYASSRGETILGIFIGGVMLLAACTLFYFLFFST